MFCVINESFWDLLTIFVRNNPCDANIYLMLTVEIAFVLLIMIISQIKLSVFNFERLPHTILLFLHGHTFCLLATFRTFSPNSALSHIFNTKQCGEIFNLISEFGIAISALF